MSDVQFDSDQTDEFGRPPQRGGVDLTGKLIVWGIVKSRKQAEYVMAGLFVLILVITYLVLT